MSRYLGTIWAVVAVGMTIARFAQEPDVEPPKPIHERIDLPSIAACGGCHPKVWKEWSESLHHRAWTNANVRTATQDFEVERCRACHSPMPVLPTGLERRPGYRSFNQDDGVHCLSCHGLEDGVAAARTIPDAPCEPRFDPRLQSADLCYPCHELTHDAFTEYEESDAFAVGVRCQDCHMPVREDAPGRSHGPHGGMNAEFVKRAIGWRCWIESGAVHVELRNRTGHKFPGEIPSRAFLVRVTFLDAAGGERVGEPSRMLLRKPRRGEDRADDRLKPDEVRVLRFELPDRSTAATVDLLFRPLPLLPDSEAFQIGRWASE